MVTGIKISQEKSIDMQFGTWECRLRFNHLDESWWPGKENLWWGNGQDSQSHLDIGQKEVIPERMINTFYYLHSLLLSDHHALSQFISDPNGVPTLQLFLTFFYKKDAFLHKSNISFSENTCVDWVYCNWWSHAGMLWCNHYLIHFFHRLSL